MALPWISRCLRMMLAFAFIFVLGIPQKAKAQATPPLFVVLPESAAEGSGSNAEGGRVFLSGPAAADVTVTLRSDAILGTPATVMIPAGRFSAGFELSIGEDELYSSDYRPRVWARIGDGPEAAGSMRVIDNDSRFFTITSPGTFWGGVPAEVVLTFASARHYETPVSRALSGQVQVPEGLVLPADARELRVPVLNPGIGEGTEQIFFQADDSVGATGLIRLLPGTQDVTGLFVDLERRAMFRGETVSFGAWLGNARGLPQYVRTTGELRLIDASGQVQFAARPIEFIDGQWTGSFVMDREGAGLKFEITAAGFTKQTVEFDVLSGGVFNEASVLDLVWVGRANTFVASIGPRTNPTGRLDLFRAETPGQTERSLGLESPAIAMSVSEDETFAWLALANRKLQKLNLLEWILSEPVAASTDALDVVSDILVLPGAGDRMVTVIGRQGVPITQLRVQLYGNGVPTTAFGQVPTSVIADLVRGRDGNEFFYQGTTRLARYSVGASLTKTAETTAITGTGRNTVYAGGALYSQPGAINPDTLAVANLYQAPGPYVFPRPDLGRLLVYNGGGLTSYDLASGELAGSASIAGLSENITQRKAIGWTRGVAFIMNAGAIVFSTPLAAPNRPDLSLSFVGPVTHSNLIQEANEPFQWEFEATNHGPGVAPGVEVAVEGLGIYRVGAMAEGERRRVRAGAVSSPGGALQANARVYCPLADSVPENNRALAQTAIRPAVKFAGHAVGMAATSVASSADFSLLFAGYAILPGVTGTGVAQIDPATGAVVRAMSGPAAPTQIAVSAGSQYMFGVTAANRITRWNLATGSVDATIMLTGETIQRIAASPTDSDRIVVATLNGVYVYDGETRLGNALNRTTTHRWLEFVGGGIWMTDGQWVQRLQANDSGITPGEAYANTAGLQRFAALGERLVFDGLVFDVTTGALRTGATTAGLLKFAEANTAVYFIGLEAISVNAATGLEIGREMMPFPLSGSWEVARIGERRMAHVNLAGQLIIYPLSIIPSTGAAADLSVRVTAPPQAVTPDPVEYEIEVGNNSAAPAANARLDLIRAQTLTDVSWEPADALAVGYRTVFEIGTLAPGALFTARLRAAGTGPVDLFAYASTADPNLENNRVTYQHTMSAPAGDLELTAEPLPASVNRGTEIQHTIRIKNNGMLDCPAVRLSYTTDGEASFPDGFTQSMAIPAGTTRQYVTKVRFNRPGIIKLTAALTAYVADSDPANNAFETLIHSLDQNAGLSEMTMPQLRTFAWNAARQEIVASFWQAEKSVLGLDPRTLAPRWKASVSGTARLLAPTPEGNHVWMALDGQRAARISIDEQRVDMEFPFTGGQAAVASIASPPGQPGTVLVGFDPGSSGQYRTQIFENGVANPNYLNTAGQIVFISGNRLVIARARFLRGYRMDAAGLTETANLDANAPMIDFGVTALGETIYLSTGRKYSLTTGEIDDAHNGTIYYTADAATGLAYRFELLNLGGAQRGWHLIAEDATSGVDLWQIPVSGNPNVGLSFLAAGEHGLITLEPQFGQLQVAPQRMGADLTIVAMAPANVAGPDVTFELNLSITNRSGWIAYDTVATVRLPEGIEIQTEGQWGAASGWELRIPKFSFGTNATLQLRGRTVGALNITGSVASDLNDPAMGDNAFQKSVAVAPLPQVLFDDIGLAEGTEPMRFWLSSPAPRAMEIQFRATPTSASEGDLTALAATASFAAGSMFGLANIIAADNTPEFDEQFRVEVTSSELPLLRSEALVTIINDDFPALSFAPSAAAPEGDEGLSIAAVALNLTSAPFATEVEYELAGETAAPGLDFVAQSGRVIFEPGETTRTISIQVIGDREFEAAETLRIELRNPRGYTFENPWARVTIANDDALPTFELRVSGLTATTVSFEFDAFAGVTYVLETRPGAAAGAWTEIPVAAMISGGRGIFTIPRPTQTESFFQVRARAN